MATSYSARSRAIEPFHVMALLARANELQVAGHDVIHLEIGEPDFTTAEPIVEAGRAALAAGHTRYTAARGLPALREQVAAKVAAFYGRRVSADAEVTIVPGATEGIFCAVQALIRAGDILALRATLARVARGEALVVQCGDCAEDMDDHHAENVARKAAVLELLAGALRLAGRRPVIRVGRIAGQYAKPRSKPHEQVGEQTLPVYRGDMVNGREAHAEQRRADPQRILKGYAAARNIMRHLGWDAASGQEANASPVWTSHEMLLLDYELSMLREDEQRRVYLGSTHWPWIGERTRQVDGAHVALLAEVLNPVACKVGPEIGRDQLLALCERLDPRREPGRLTLIARMGAQKVGERLPPLVEAVRAAGHPVIWLSDPMHGNTIVAPCGNKTRLVRSIAEEVAAFRLAVSGSGGVAAGLHLETTPDDVTECVADSSGLHQVSRHYTSLCDPRLNPWQALSAVMAWSGAEAIPSATFPLETVA